MPDPTFVVVVDVPEREDRFYVFARPEDASAFGHALETRGLYTVRRREPVLDEHAARLLISAELSR